MSFQNCIDEIQKAAGREFSDEELDELFSELQKRARNNKARDKLGDDGFAEAAAEIGAEQQQAAIIAKRNEALNRVRRAEALDFIRSGFADNPVLGLEAWMVGANRPVAGARNSADTQAKGMAAKYTSAMLRDLDWAGLLPEINRGTLDRQIANEMEAIGTPGMQPGVSGSAKARQAAEIFHKYNELARSDANASGAWVGRQWGYIVRQSHDMDRIRGAGFEEWRDFILDKLDARTFDNRSDPETFLRHVWQGLASGVHIKNTANDAVSGFKGPQNVAKAISQDRLLHFKSADDWFDYNERFGRGNLREAMLFGLERMGRTTGLMNAMGPNPGANLDMVFKELMQQADKAGDVDMVRNLQQSETMLQNRLGYVDGTQRIAANQMIGAVGSGMRVLQSTSKLGGATLSAISDIPLAASELRYQGDSMLTGASKIVRGMVDNLTNARDKRDAAASLGVVSDGMTYSILSRFDSTDSLPGLMTDLQRAFFKWNGLTWWTDSIRQSGVLAMGHRLALNKNEAWDALSPDLQRSLRNSGIQANEWDIARQASRMAADGREYVTPEAVRELPDEAFTTLLQGRKPTKARMRNLRNEIENKIRDYYIDRSSFLALEPDAKTQSLVSLGTQRGTVGGELARVIMQFKSFPIAILQKTWGREVYGRGANTLGEALKNGNGEYQAMAQLFVWLTTFGFMAMTAKDLAKGRTPRDPLDPRAWTAAALQGGAMGILGDLLFGELKNRFGGGVVSTLAGPTAGTVDSVADVVGRIISGEDPSAQAFRTLINNTPFANIFYFRMGMDALILNRVQETLSPGYMRRLERRLEKENEQELLWTGV